MLLLLLTIYNSTSSHTRIDNKYSGLGVIYRSSIGYIYHSTVPPDKTSYCNEDMGIFTELLSFFFSLFFSFFQLTESCL